MSEVYDRVYIGTGPINIVDAYLRSQKGERVALIDSKTQIGGAWVAIPVGDYGRIEIGCHIWSYNKKVYDYLNELLDLHLVDMKPQPYFLNGNSKLIYDHKNLLITSKRLVKDVFTARFGKAVDFIRNHPMSRIPLIPKTYQYPKGGAREFQLKLEKLIKSTDAAILLNNEVQDVIFKDGLWTVKGEDGSAIQSKKVEMTATSHMKQVVYNDTVIDLNYRFLTYTHYHIVVSGDLAKEITYVRVLKHPQIHRISDVTNQLSTERMNETVLLVGVFDDKIAEWGSESNAAEKIMEYLIKKGFLDASNKMIYFKKNRFPTAYIHGDQRVVINKLHESIHLNSTTDLIYGFYYKLRDWKKEGLI